MIKFHKVRYKNFLSTGNEFTEIDFSFETGDILSLEYNKQKSEIIYRN